MSRRTKRVLGNRLASTVKIAKIFCEALFVLGMVVTNAQAGTLYRLNKDSTFQQGCFPPCLCPITTPVPVKGTFVLTPTGFDGLFDTYAVTDVNWLVSIGGTDTIVTGSGTY